MAVTPYELRSYPGAAADTVLNGAINALALGFSLAAGTGVSWPDGTQGPFFVVIDYDNTSTEKLHCTSRTGDAVVVDVRGADGTTAVAHSDQAKIRVCWTATDAQEANRTAHETLGAVAAKGDLLVGQSAATLVKKAVGADGTVLTAQSAVTGGVAWGTTLTGFTITDATVDATSQVAGAALDGQSVTDLTLDATSSLGGITGTQLAADQTTLAAHTTALGKIAAPLSGHLAASLGEGTPSGTIFTIALTAGTWVLNVGVHLNIASGTGGGAASIAAAGAGGITLSGKLTATGSVETSTTQIGPADIDLFLTFVATVATPGNVTVSLTTATSITNIIGGAGASTGYTAVQVA